LGWAPLAVAVALLMLVPGGGRADYYPPQCGGLHVAEPAHHPAGQRPPLAIGDSTMLLALYNLSGEGFEANAQGCRQWDEALSILQARKAAGTLPHMVVIALGADGSVTYADIGLTLGILCCDRLLVLVTPRELGGGWGSDAATVRDEARRHPKRILLLDWVAYAAGHPDWFQPDGLHLTTGGAAVFARFVGRSMKYAYPPSARRPSRHRHKTRRS
jgi:hypothetical protein